MRFATATVISVLCLALTACSDSASGYESADAGPSTTAATTGEPSAATSSTTTIPVLARVEGAWQCDVQRFAFDDLAEQDAMLGERLEAADVSRADYQAFKDALADDAALRAAVMQAYVEACPGSTSGIDGETVNP